MIRVGDRGVLPPCSSERRDVAVAALTRSEPAESSKFVGVCEIVAAGGTGDCTHNVHSQRHVSNLVAGGDEGRAPSLEVVQTAFKRVHLAVSAPIPSVQIARLGCNDVYVWTLAKRRKA